MATATMRTPPVIGESVDRIHIDVSLIPDYKRDQLCAATLEFIKGILRQPAGREMLDAETARRHAAQAAAKSTEEKAPRRV